MNKNNKNYDLPFENKIDAEFDEYYEIEDLYNTEFGGINQVFPPGGSFTNLPSDLFISPDVNKVDLLEQYRKFSEYEDLENLE